MKYKTARSLYNHISQKYHDNRNRASNDVTELPATLNLLGDLKHKKILDMGCGLGKHAKEFIKRGGIVTGYDASEKMIKLAKKYCKGKGSFFRSTHETATLESNSFDICNASFSINYSKNLDPIFKNVWLWLKTDGIFTFSIPHPIWYSKRSESMDYSKPHKIWLYIDSYDLEIFNYYHPLDEFIQLINNYNFKLLNLVEATISRRYKGWPEEKYRLPSTFVFKLQKL